MTGPEPLRVTDEDFRRAVESISPEKLGERTNSLINEFLANTGKRPEAETPVPGGSAYGSLEVTHKGSSSSGFTLSELVVRLGNDKDTYSVTLSSKKKIGTDAFEPGHAEFIHERWKSGKRKEIIERLDGVEALERARNFFSEYRFKVR